MPQRQLTETELRQLALLCGFTAWTIPAVFTAQILDFERAIDSGKFSELRSLAKYVQQDFMDRFAEAIRLTAT